VEFVCGQRAVITARRDYATLVEAAAMYSGHIWDVPQQVKKFVDDLRAANKATERLLEELAEFEATSLLAETARVSARKIVVRLYSDRDLGFIRLLAQKMTRLDANTVALLAASPGQAALVFAQSKGGSLDMGALLKETVASRGGKGGGTRDMAQGGVPTSDSLGSALEEAASKVKTQA
jgi:alanyl-tRNA synthetase